MEEQIFDVVIVGAGPAGLQAAIHAVRKKASVLVLGKPEASAIARAHVENYLCVDGVSDGIDMLNTGLAQITRFGAVHQEADVLKIEQDESGFLVETEQGKVRAISLILATGTGRKKLKVKGEKELLGRGVSYCVDCDANFFRNAKVAVVGDGSAAADGAITLVGYTPDVTLITRELNVADDLHKKLVDSAVTIKNGTWVKEILGEQAVTGVLLEDETSIEVEGLFIELGAKGAVELAVNLGVMLDSETFTHIETNKKQETNIAGIYAAGDIAGMPYQMAKAVGEGCVAGWEAANFAHAKKRKTASEED